MIPTGEVSNHTYYFLKTFILPVLRKVGKIKVYATGKKGEVLLITGHEGREGE